MGTGAYERVSQKARSRISRQDLSDTGRKTLHHLYNTLNLIFGFAEKQELLVKNPMKLVDSPKKVKKPVDALTEEQAKKIFLSAPCYAQMFHVEKLLRQYLEVLL